MSWIQTYTRKKFPLERPAPGDVWVEDIAHALSMSCRFGGHTNRFYSVAEHCVLMAMYARSRHGLELAFECLLHDADEAYLIDLPKPVKNLCPDYQKLEGSVRSAIVARFMLSLSDHTKAKVKELDNRILITERDVLLGGAIEPWVNEPEPLPTLLPCWDWQTAKRKFLEMYAKLRHERIAANPDNTHVHPPQI